MSRTPAGRLYECWLSPEAWEKFLVRRKKIGKQNRQRLYADEKKLEAYREYMANRAREQRRVNPVPFMLRAAKGRAKKQGLPFELTAADVVMPTHCPVLGVPLLIGEGAPTDNSPELDKVVPALGYVAGNVIVTSRKANRIKTDASIEELQRVAAFYSRWPTRQDPEGP